MITGRKSALIALVAAMCLLFGYIKAQEPETNGNESFFIVGKAPLPGCLSVAKFSFAAISKSPQWNPLDAAPCPLPIDKAIRLVRDDLEKKFGSKASGTVNAALTLLPVKVTPSGKEFGRYCYVVELGLTNIGFPEAREPVSYHRVVGAVLLDGTLADLSEMKQAKTGTGTQKK